MPVASFKLSEGTIGASTPRFGNAASSGVKVAEFAGDKMLDSLLKHVPAIDKLSGDILKNKEHTDGLSWMKFAQDTAINWMPKFLVSRSGIERLEASFVEFVESGYYYFVGPASAQHGFSKLFHALSPDKNNVTRKMITTPLEDLAEDAKRKVMPIKLATWIASIGTLSGLGTYGLNFVKNLMTDKIFKKTDFGDIVNLNKNHPELEKAEHEKNEKVSQKAILRLKQLAVLGAGLIIGSAALARYGSKINALQKPMAFALKHLDFEYGKTTDTFGLKESMLPVIIGMSIIGYIDAARDDLERWEVAMRTPITGGYLMAGASMIERATQKLLGKHYPDIFKINAKGKKEVKTLQELGQEALTKATQELGQHASAEAIEKKAANLMLPNLKGKSMLFWTPNLFSMGVVGFMVAIMNQQFTRYRYQKALKEQAQSPVSKPAMPEFSSRTSFSAQMLAPTTQADPFAAFTY